DADLEGHLADREGLAHALTLARDDGALEDLDTGAAALDDVHVHLDGVARAEVRNIGLERGGVDAIENVGHGVSLPAPAAGRTQSEEWSGCASLETAPLRQSARGTIDYSATVRRDPATAPSAASSTGRSSPRSM